MGRGLAWVFASWNSDERKCRGDDGVGPQLVAQHVGGFQQGEADLFCCQAASMGWREG